MNGGFAYRERVGPAGAGRTVLDYLTASYRHSTEADWSARLRAGAVELDGRPAAGAELLHSGQVLVWHRPAWREPDVPLRFEVLHEDDAVVAVDKPSGLPMMPAGGFLDHTLLALVQARYPGARPLHRLGRFTSGVVLFARSGPASAALGQAWRAHEVTKDYRALGGGVPLWEAREVRVPIGPVPHPRLGLVHAARDDGRPAHSAVTVVERRPDATLFDVRITTGRPHQIRIHLAWLGHPLTGDPLYGVGGIPHPVDPGLPGDGGYLLHAHRLTFAHPSHGRTCDIEAPLPSSLVAGMPALVPRC